MTAKGDEVVGQLKRLVPQLRERGKEAEQLRRLPEATLADLATARVFDALRPVEAGGLQLSLQDFVDITRTVSCGDASTGWLASFYMGHTWLLSKFEKEAQDKIFAGRPSVLAVATVSSAGSSERCEGGHRITGRWRFASGIMHAEWAILVAFGDRGPLLCAVPVESLKIHDVWHVPGMKGTGSNDVEAHQLFVPDALAQSFPSLNGWDAPGAHLYDYPLLRCPLQLVLALIHPAVALGVADAALELFPSVIAGRMRVPAGTRVIDEPAIHDTFAQALDERRCAELRLRDAVELIEGGLRSQPVGLSEERSAEANIAITASGERAFRVVDMLVRNAGASVHRDGHPFDRICRDTQVMRNHTVIDARYHLSAAGRVLLLGPEPGGLQSLKGAPAR